MAIKQYESNFSKHSIPVRVRGRSVRIEFRGGTRYPHKRGGMFITGSTNIQKALERRADFGKKFKLVKTTKTRDEQLSENDEQLERLIAEPIEQVKAKPVEVPESKGTVVDEVTKFQEGRNYLVRTFPELTMAEVKSKALVREVAAKNGILFPNWPTE